MKAAGEDNLRNYFCPSRGVVGREQTRWTGRCFRTQTMEMPKPKSQAFARIRAEVIRLVALIPEGKFTTYGSIAVHMNVGARHVAFVMSSLTAEESATLPWHRVVGADGRQSQAMPPTSARRQRALLKAEGMTVRQGFIRNPDDYYFYPGPRRSIRWSEQKTDAP